MIKRPKGCRGSRTSPQKLKMKSPTKPTFLDWGGYGEKPKNKATFFYVLFFLLDGYEPPPKVTPFWNK